MTGLEEEITAAERELAEAIEYAKSPLDPQPLPPWTEKWGPVHFQQWEEMRREIIRLQAAGKELPWGPVRTESAYVMLKDMAKNVRAAGDRAALEALKPVHRVAAAITRRHDARKRKKQ